MSLKNLPFKSRMFLLVGVFLLVLVGSHAMYGMMLSSIRVNGPVYDRIAQGKDIIADLVPTNNNESYITFLQLLEEPDPAHRQESIRRLEKLEKAYEDRHAFVEKTLEDGPLKEAVVVKCYAPGKEFYRIVNEQVIAPLRAGKQPQDISPEVRRKLSEIHSKRSQALAA